MTDDPRKTHETIYRLSGNRVCHAHTHGRYEDHATFNMDHEFTCVECGRWITVINLPLPSPRLCNACVHFPFWFTDMTLRCAMDPAHPGSEVTPAMLGFGG